MAARSPRPRWLVAAAALAALLLAVPFLLPAQTARGKAGVLPNTTPSPPARAQAASLALADPRVQALLAGRRAEVMAVLPVGAQLTPASLACTLSLCRLVEIYDFESDATASAVVDLRAGLVREVLFQPRQHPGPDQRLMDLAVAIARRSPEFAREVGRVPSAAELAAMPSGMPGTACDQGHICLAVTAPQGRSLVWAVVDVTAEQLVAVLRTPTLPDAANTGSAAPSAPSDCPASGTVARGGWSLSYETTPTDGLRVYSVSYLGVPVLNSAKLVEWHVDYGTVGFVDEIGCASLFIFPYGGTQVLDLTSGTTLVGFELVQDFRMQYWGTNCNYRYEQHDQFYNDGSFRVVAEAYGRGCSTNGIYRPILRLDFGLGGPGGDSFDTWNGAGWQPQSTEGWWSQAGPYTPQGALWRVTAEDGHAYDLVPGQGQFGDGGRGDFAYLYATQHHAAEGDTDLGAIGLCCNDDYHQGPERFINGESIADQRLVLWYVPQMQTDVTPGAYYCWTLPGNPDPIGYPCPAGPLFVPKPLAAAFVDSAPQPPGATVVFTSTSGGVGPLQYHWDFGDGLGNFGGALPSYAYASAGLYTVTLTISDTTGTQSVARQVAIGLPPSASFSYGLSRTISNTVLFTNTTSGSLPLSFQWDYGDGATSTAPSASHTYAQPGLYTVALTATNFVASSSISRWVAVPPVRYYWPVIGK